MSILRWTQAAAALLLVSATVIATPSRPEKRRGAGTQNRRQGRETPCRQRADGHGRAGEGQDSDYASWDRGSRELHECL